MIWLVILPILHETMDSCQYVWRLMSTCSLKLSCRGVGLQQARLHSTSKHFIWALQTLVEGSPASFAPVLCDVRDVARAHVLAAEMPSASGRYIVSAQKATAPPEIQRLLQVCGPMSSSGMWFVHAII